MKYTCYLFLLQLMGLQLLIANPSKGQGLKETIISLQMKNAHLTDIFDAIEKKTEFEFVYNKAFANIEDTYTVDYTKKNLAQIFKDLSRRAKIKFKQINKTISVAKLAYKPVPDQTLAGEAFDKVISGKVTDEAGNPLPGASIIVKGSTIGTTTDVDGNYVLNVPDNAATLQFTYIGHIVEEVEISGRAIIDIVLYQDITTLGEITVSTGYWETAQRLNVGNIEKVTAKEIETQPITNVLQAVQGRAAGIYIQQQTGVPGGGIDIQIRGRNSLGTGGNPFYIVDGVPFPSGTISAGNIGSALASGSRNSPLFALNPEDIESIEILKDADATAIYGSLGANGVVLITTKKGRQGKTRVKVNVSQGFGKVANRLDLLDTDQYIQIRQESIVNSGLSSISQETLERIYPDVFLWDADRNTDWQKELIGHTANQTNADLSVTGGSETTNFLVSLGYFKESTVFPTDEGFSRYSGQANLSHTSYNKRFKLSLSTNFSSSANTLPGIDLTSAALTLPSHAPPPYDENGNLNFDQFFDNPLQRLQQEYNGETLNLIASLRIDYELFKGFNLVSSMSYNIQQLDATQITPKTSINPNKAGSRERTSSFLSGKTKAWVFEPQIDYRLKAGKAGINLLGGVTFRSDVNESQAIVARGFSNDAFLLNADAATNINIAGAPYTEYRYNAAFARINFDWDGKYLVNITGRRDGSSRFGPNNRFGNFGAVAGAWVFSAEDWFGDALPFISFGKIRSSYGITGNDQIGDYQYLDTYSFTNNPYNDVPGLVVTRLSNPDFSWETVRKLEVGMELGIFEDRIFTSISWYRNRTTDQLVGLPLSLATGDFDIQFNLPAVVENRGWEFELTSTNMTSGNFQWTTNFNLTIPVNELVAFDRLEDFPAFDRRYVVGESINGLSSKYYEFRGVDPETGLYDFVDKNEDGQITFAEDARYMEVGQEYFGGLQNSFRYKSIELAFLLQFVKQTGFNQYRFANQIGTFGNLPAEFADRWQQPGDRTRIQRPEFWFQQESGFLRISDAVIEDASFIRLNNLSLAYLFPEKILNKLNIEGLRFSAQGRNLFTITNLNALDPEGGGFGSTLPPLRFISLGLQATF